MRIKYYQSLYGGVIIIVLFLSLYLMSESLNFHPESSGVIKLKELEYKLNHLEQELQSNEVYISKLQKKIKKLVEQDDKQAPISQSFTPVNRTVALITQNDCLFGHKTVPKADVEVLNIYDIIKFDNPNGGVWKQGWNIEYSKGIYNSENILKVIVVPHSHNDPGWIKTFEKYFQDQTIHIISNAVNSLSEKDTRKFIWAEISFLSLWWEEVSDSMRQKFKKLLDNNQIEIVTGGWVMTDEANSHYYAMLEQLITGHEWLSNTLGVKPQSGWAIDPFGLTSTMPYLLRRCGLNSLVIQRVHYSIKKYLAENLKLEFLWRQQWDASGWTELMTHVMPFYSYDIPHTCGPDPKICCQFDFKRMPPFFINCPWNVNPQEISQNNVESKASILLDQYRKKAQLFKSNVVLVPLGDDFRYQDIKEWDAMMRNYERLMDFMNSRKDWGVQIQFGTLQDYFKEVEKEIASKSITFPSLTGNFFTYADRDDHYWSGYYTTRPFYKSMSRTLEDYLRSAEITYSLMCAQMGYFSINLPDFMSGLFRRLVSSRRSLSLFQHHDGITGTAKTHVVNDYANKMHSSLKNCMYIIQQSVNFLLLEEQVNFVPDEDAEYFTFHEFMKSPSSTLSFTVLDLISIDSRQVIFINTATISHDQVVQFRTNTPYVEVNDQNGNLVLTQVSPVLEDMSFSNSVFEISFAVKLGPLEIIKYQVAATSSPDLAFTKYCSILILHGFNEDLIQIRPFTMSEQKENVFRLRSTYIEAEFDKSGTLTSINSLTSNISKKLKLDFIHYGVRQTQETSGAYLFLPDGEAHILPMDKKRSYAIVGPVVSSVVTVTSLVTQHVKLLNSGGVDSIGLDIINEVNIKSQTNFELGMRITTTINNKEVFYTDLNGFQIAKRKYYSKIPLQGNFYPIPSLIFIEDDQSRLTLITKQPLGGSSLYPGSMEVLLDRRLSQDDNRGLNQAIVDNVVARSSFRLILEHRTTTASESATVALPSLAIHHATFSLNHPVKVLFKADKYSGKINPSYLGADKDLSCDVMLVNLRTQQNQSTTNFESFQPSSKTALILHRVGFDCAFKPVGLNCQTRGGKFSLGDLFSQLYSDTYQQSSLSLNTKGLALDKGYTISLNPMELYSFELTR